MPQERLRKDALTANSFPENKTMEKLWDHNQCHSLRRKFQGPVPVPILQIISISLVRIPKKRVSLNLNVVTRNIIKPRDHFVHKVWIQSKFQMQERHLVLIFIFFFFRISWYQSKWS